MSLHSKFQKNSLAKDTNVTTERPVTLARLGGDASSSELGLLHSKIEQLVSSHGQLKA